MLQIAKKWTNLHRNKYTDVGFYTGNLFYDYNPVKIISFSVSKNRMLKVKWKNDVLILIQRNSEKANVALTCEMACFSISLPFCKRQLLETRGRQNLNNGDNYC